MFSKKPLEFRQTLTFRLSLWYAGIFTISSCVAFFLFYLLITSVIQERTDQDLQEQAHRFASILSAQGIEAVKRIAVLEARAAGEKKIFVRLLYPSGITFSSSNMSYWQDIQIDSDAIQQLLEGQRQVFRSISISSRKHKVRIIYTAIGSGILLQSGQSMESYTRIIEVFQKIFIITMSTLFIVSALIGGFMARRALSGFNVIDHTARRIAATGTLSERVPVKPQGDEIDQLAETFNKMLDRIETLVTGIKEMSDNIAHDLKSPIARIRGNAEITLTSEASLDAYQEMAADTIEDCDRLLDMINTMLLISRTQAGVNSLQYESLDIAALVRSACELFAPMAEDKEILMDCHISESRILQGDQRMIQRLVANILDNAVKYTPRGGKITVSVQENKDREILISVRDTGIGIAPEALPHIFERFYRCDQSRTPEGSGLGLSLAETIAEAHGGDISVTSTPGQGSRFTVRLPKSPCRS